MFKVFFSERILSEWIENYFFKKGDGDSCYSTFHLEVKDNEKEIVVGRLIVICALKEGVQFYFVCVCERAKYVVRNY